MNWHLQGEFTNWYPLTAAILNGYQLVNSPWRCQFIRERFLSGDILSFDPSPNAGSESDMAILNGYQLVNSPWRCYFIWERFLSGDILSFDPSPNDGSESDMAILNGYQLVN